MFIVGDNEMNLFNIYNGILKLDAHFRQELIISGFVLSVGLFLVTTFIIAYNRFDFKAKKKLTIIFTGVFIWDLVTLGFKLNIFVFIFYAVLCVYTGKLLMEKLLKINGKNFITYCSEFLLGFYVLGFIYFLFSHKFFFRRFGTNFNRIAFITLIILICIYVLLHIKNIKSDFINISEVVNENQSIIILMAFTLVCSYFIVFNYNVISQWAWNGDKMAHLEQTFYLDIISNNGFPLQKLYPFAFQQALFVPTSVFNLVSINQLIMSHNFFGFINLFCIFVIPFEFSKKLGLNKFSSFLSSLLTVFYGAIGAPIINSYLGFINISTTMYHNTTEFYALPLVLLCVYYIYNWLGNKEAVSSIILSIFLLDISFFIKPNAYMILGPVICILFVIMFLRSKEVRNLKIIIPSILILLPTIFWEIYPIVFRIPKTTTQTAIGKFGELFFCYFDDAYKPLNFNIYDKVFFMITFSFIGIFFAVIFGRIKDNFNKKFFYLFLLPVFIIGLLVASIFVEGGKFRHDGNFLWQICLLGCCLMPFISELANGIKNKTIRNITYSILILHIFSGFWHLLMYNIFRTL